MLGGEDPATSSRRSCTSSRIRKSSSARFASDVARQAGKAAFAAATAAPTSSVVARSTSPDCRPSAGLKTGPLRLDVPLTRLAADPVADPRESFAPSGGRGRQLGHRVLLRRSQNRVLPFGHADRGGARVQLAGLPRSPGGRRGRAPSRAGGAADVRPSRRPRSRRAAPGGRRRRRVLRACVVPTRPGITGTIAPPVTASSFPAPLRRRERGHGPRRQLPPAPRRRPLAAATAGTLWLEHRTAPFPRVSIRVVKRPRGGGAVRSIYLAGGRFTASVEGLVRVRRVAAASRPRDSKATLEHHDGRRHCAQAAPAPSSG